MSALPTYPIVGAGSGSSQFEAALLSRRILNEESLELVERLQGGDWESIAAELVAKGLVEPELPLQAMAAHFGVGAWRLLDRPPKVEALSLLDEIFCKRYNVVPLQVSGDTLALGMVDPTDVDAIREARERTGRRIEPHLILSSELREFQEGRLRGNARPKEASIEDLANQVVSSDSVQERAGGERTALSEEDVRPVVGIVNRLLSDAINSGASDIHIEPRASEVVVRFRQDGELRPVASIPKQLMPMISTRIKILSELDIVEVRLPQNGRIGVELNGRQVDLRVSTAPSKFGERIVLRVLDKSTGLLSIDEVGLDGSARDAFHSLIERPYGLILVTGPTGSGKTTTLYGALASLQSDTRNIMTCEDPIEYELQGINQTQVNMKAGLDFATQTRAMLRQDPDVILIGEIRDRETAEVAIRAAMTGHLVFSTLHCNDVYGAVPRLHDLGVPDDLIESSLIGVTSQRLVRVLCPDCKRERELSGLERAVFEQLGVTPPQTVFEPVGCARCENSGWRGRLGIHEVLELDAWCSDAASGAVLDIAELRRKRFPRMQHDGLSKIAQGLTTFDEVRRKVPFPAAVQSRAAA